MSDVPGTPSGDDLKEKPPTNQQGQEAGRCDLPPDASLFQRPERFRSSNETGNWESVSKNEARLGKPHDSGQGDDYRSHPDTHPPSRRRTGMANRGGAGDETALKTMGTTKPQQPKLYAASPQGYGFPQARGQTYPQQPHLTPADPQGYGFAQARGQTYPQQPHLRPADPQGYGFAQARGQTYSQQLRPADMSRESEKKDPTCEKSAQGTVDPGRNPTQKSPIQAGATQTQKQEIKGEMSKRRDTRTRLMEHARQTSPMQMSPTREHMVGGLPEPLAQEHGPPATEIIRPSGSMERSTSVEQSGAATERVQTPLEPGSPLADLEEVDRDTGRSCTACVGTLLEHAGNSIDVNRMKQKIVLELGPDQFHDNTRTIFGAVVVLLPNKEECQLAQLMHAPGTGRHETCVHNMIRELKAEGKKMGHLVHYFSQEKTKRADIVKLITKIHQCDFCLNTAADVI